MHLTTGRFNAARRSPSCLSALEIVLSIRAASERRKTLGAIEEPQIHVGLEADLPHDGGVLFRSAVQRRAFQGIPQSPDLIECGVRGVRQR